MSSDETMVEDGEAMETDAAPVADYDISDFVVVMDEVEAPRLQLSKLRPGLPDDWFVQAKHPRGNEQKITDQGSRTELDYSDVKKKRTNGDGGGGVKGQVHFNPGAYFLAKCRYQIMDFALPLVPKGKTAQVLMRYDSANGGANKSNQEVYEAILYSPKQGLREMIEDYLDAVAGREAGADYEWDALGNAPGQ